MRCPPLKDLRQALHAGSAQDRCERRVVLRSLHCPARKFDAECVRAMQRPTAQCRADAAIKIEHRDARSRPQMLECRLHRCGVQFRHELTERRRPVLQAPFVNRRLATPDQVPATAGKQFFSGGGMTVHPATLESRRRQTGTQGIEIRWSEPVRLDDQRRLRAGDVHEGQRQSLERRQRCAQQRHELVHAPAVHGTRRDGYQLVTAHQAEPPTGHRVPTGIQRDAVAVAETPFRRHGVHGLQDVLPWRECPRQVARFLFETRPI